MYLKRRLNIFLLIFQINDPEYWLYAGVLSPSVNLSEKGSFFVFFWKHPTNFVCLSSFHFHFGISNEFTGCIPSSINTAYRLCLWRFQTDINLISFKCYRPSKQEFAFQITLKFSCNLQGSCVNKKSFLWRLVKCNRELKIGMAPRGLWN